jgi:hypothetical protein
MHVHVCEEELEELKKRHAVSSFRSITHVHLGQMAGTLLFNVTL